MKRIAFLLLFLTTPAMAQDPLPKPSPKLAVPKEIVAKAGELIVIPAESKGAVFFSWDETIFPAKRAIQDGNKLYLTTPFNSKTVVNVVMIEEKTQSKINVIVTGGIDPDPNPPPPEPDGSLATLTAQVKALTKLVNEGFAKQNDFNAKLDARVTALEGAKPPPVPIPVDSFQAAVQAAYVADGKPAAAVANLAAIYKQSGPTVNNQSFTKASEILSTMHAAAQSLIGDQLPMVRRVLADELNANLGKTDKTLDAATRAAISAQFFRMQKALEGVK